MKKKILLTGTTGFIGYEFLQYALKNNYLVVDILRYKNKNNQQIKNLKKNYKKNYKTIFYRDFNEIYKKLNNLKFDFFINFSTLYLKKHSFITMQEMMNSNIIFPSLILETIKDKCDKFINIGSMMEHEDGKNFIPLNFYASSKSAFQMIANFFYKNKKMYNIKLYETYGERDKRKKIIPTIIKSIKLNKIFYIYSKKLKINIIHVDDVIKAIDIIMRNKVKPGSYVLKNKNEINIYNLLKKLEFNLKKKLDYKFLNYQVKTIHKTNLKVMPYWISKFDLLKTLTKKLNNENIKNKN